MTEKILFLTVGGSAAPIVQAIQGTQPTHVVFLCSSGKYSSRVQVEGKGKCIKTHPADDKPTLPNIPTQTELAEDAWNVYEAAPDELNDIFEIAEQAFSDMRERFTGAELVADYTGGTKSMSAGLVLAAMHSGDVALQLVRGKRTDLQQVQGNRSKVQSVREDLHRQLQIRTCLDGWQRYAYQQAQYSLRNIPAPQNNTLFEDWQRAQDLSEAFAAWHAFDHMAAWQIFTEYRDILGPQWPIHLDTLKRLAQPEPDERRDVLQLWDLWRNAERCATAGHFDDAVARLYRLIEWTAQQILKREANLMTADLPADKLADVAVSRNREGKYQAGLFAAWQLVEQHTNGSGHAFFRDHRDTLNNQIQRRNNSILAHGFEPITAPAWQEMHTWMESAFIPLLKEMAEAVNIRQGFPQLPDHYPWG